MKPPPVCRKCNKSHWGFVRCEEVIAQRTKRPQPALKAPAGFRAWGDRFHTYARQGENTFVLPRKHINSSNKLTYPKDA